MAEVTKGATEPPTSDCNVIAFPVGRAPRIQGFSDDQMVRLIWLLNQTEVLEKLIRNDVPKLMHGCPIARQILSE